MNSTRGAGTSHRAFRRLWIMAFAWAATTCALATQPPADLPADTGTLAASAADTTHAADTAATDAAATAPVLDTVMPRPKALERDVQFWVHVYTQVDTNGGYLLVFFFFL